MEVNPNHTAGPRHRPRELSAVRSGFNRSGSSRVRLMMFVGFLGLAFLMAAPALVGMVRPKPPDAVGWISDFAEAQAAAGRTGKPMIVKFSADWCGPCQMLSREVFSDPQVGQFIRGAFVPVVVDVTDRHGAGQRTANQFQVDALPTLVVLSREGLEQSRKIGYLDKPALLQWLEGYSPASPAESSSMTN